LSKILTIKPRGHKPATVTGKLVKDWPLRGAVMVAPVVGGALARVPVIPIEPFLGFSGAGAAADTVPTHIEPSCSTIRLLTTATASTRRNAARNTIKGCFMSNTTLPANKTLSNIKRLLR